MEVAIMECEHDGKKWVACKVFNDTDPVSEVQSWRDSFAFANSNFCIVRPDNEEQELRRM